LGAYAEDAAEYEFADGWYLSLGDGRCHRYFYGGGIFGRDGEVAYDAGVDMAEACVGARSWRYLACAADAISWR